MNTITIDRATVEQALGAMNEAVFSLYSPYTSETPEEKALYETIAAFRAALTQQAEPVLQTCNCRWDGDVQVQQCTLHEAHVDAIHEWAERAKVAERKLAQQAEPVAQQAEPLTVERLRDALVASRIIQPAAVEDPEEYDDGVMLHRIEALHRRIT